MKRIHLDDIESQYKLKSYPDLYEKVLSLILAKNIKPVKASGTNGKKPALYKEYWLLEEQEDNSDYIEELSSCMFRLFLPIIICITSSNIRKTGNGCCS